MLTAGGSSSHISDALAGIPKIDRARACRTIMGTYAECPLCAGDLFPEHAHFRCAGCGWRDSCCD